MQQSNYVYVICAKLNMVLMIYLKCTLQTFTDLKRWLYGLMMKVALLRGWTGLGHKIHYYRFCLCHCCFRNTSERSLDTVLFVKVEKMKLKLLKKISQMSMIMKYYQNKLF